MPGLVPQGEGPHSIKPLEAFGSPFSVGVEDDFGVGLGLERVSQRFEFFANFEVIVDFPVKSDAERLVLGLHGLIAERRKVQDGQPPVSQPEPRPLASGQANFVMKHLSAAVFGVGKERKTISIRSPVVDDLGH